MRLSQYPPILQENGINKMMTWKHDYIAIRYLFLYFYIAYV